MQDRETYKLRCHSLQVKWREGRGAIEANYSVASGARRTHSAY